MRQLAPGQELAWFHRLQQAFYAEAVDVTDPEAWRPLIAEFDVDADALVELATSEEGKALAWRDFLQARKWGISGFPTLLVRDGDDLSLVTRGWAPTDALVDGIGRWLNDRQPVPEGEACAVDGDC
jgi:putative protein-disulfide isomerase